MLFKGFVHATDFASYFAANYHRNDLAITYLRCCFNRMLRVDSVVFLVTPNVTPFQSVLSHFFHNTVFVSWITAEFWSCCPINMPQCARNGLELARCFQHRASSGPVLAYGSMFTRLECPMCKYQHSLIVVVLQWICLTHCCPNKK